MDVIYLDFSKAFDRVDHKIVVTKVKKLGIKGKLLLWLEEFLTNRSQKTIVQGHESVKLRVLSGVPQGTVLAPLLFIIMLNDINEAIHHCSIYSFADDTRILKTIESVLNCQELQDDLKNIYKYAKSNKLQFNENKFELIKFGNNHDLKKETSYKCSKGDNIEEKINIKDLGIIMSNNLSF